MAKVTVVWEEDNNEVQCGDYVVIDEEVYMISQISYDKYLLIGMSDGNRWDDRPFSYVYTIDNLMKYIQRDDNSLKVKYVKGKDCEIEIRLNKDKI